MIDEVKIFIDIKIRINWLIQLMHDPHCDDQVNPDIMTIEQKYRKRMKPLFQINSINKGSLDTEDVVTYLLIHEKDGLI